jgi:hypothetical protein
MPRGTTITIPDEVDLAIRAEAYRIGCRPGEILVRWLRSTFPDYVRSQLESDLNGQHSEIGSPDAATPPAGTEGVTNLNSPQSQVTKSIPPGDLTDEESIGGNRAV